MICHRFECFILFYFYFFPPLFVFFCFQHQLKLVLIGDSSVGKSSILLRFTDDEFHERLSSTIGVDFKTRDMQFRGLTIRCVVWDTAGQEKFRAMTSSYYRGAHGIVLVYDVTNRDSFVHVSEWLNEIGTYVNEDERVLLLVGNKIDLEARAVSKQEGEAFAREKNMVFIEVKKARARVVKIFWLIFLFSDKCKDDCWN